MPTKSKGSTRNISTNANQRLLTPSTKLINLALTLKLLQKQEADRYVLNQLDGRLFNPNKLTPSPGPTKRRFARLNIDPTRNLVGFPHPGLRFARPDKIAVCVRRKRRREVLHALRLTNKRSRGSGGGRRRNRTPWSNVKC